MIRLVEDDASRRWALTELRFCLCDSPLVSILIYVWEKRAGLPTPDFLAILRDGDDLLFVARQGALEISRRIATVQMIQAVSRYALLETLAVDLGTSLKVPVAAHGGQEDERRQTPGG